MKVKTRRNGDVSLTADRTILRALLLAAFQTIDTRIEDLPEGSLKERNKELRKCAEEALDLLFK